VGPHGAGSAAEQLRTAEVIGTLCLATDLGMGFPFEHGLHTTVIAMRLVDRLGVDRQTAVQTYYGSLLSHAGCTTDAHLAAEVFGGSLTEHLNPVMYGSSREVMTGLIRALPDPGASGPARAIQIGLRLPRMVGSSRPSVAANCEVAGMLAEQTGAPAAVAASLAYLTDRWDGKGPLRRAAADAIPLSMRIVHVAIDAALQRRLAGEEFAARLIGEHAGRGLDPEVAGCVAADAPELLSFTDGSSVWEEALAAEPRPWLRLAQVGLELHPDKTRIVYCKDSNRRDAFEHTAFTFLGYTFRPRLAKNRHGKRFVSFLPAVSKEAIKAMSREIRSWHIARRSDKSLGDLARMFNSIVQGWINYYGRFYKSALYPLLRRINEHLVRWAMRKYKRLRRREQRAGELMAEASRRSPRLFAHWCFGLKPDGWTIGAV
jgi:hypothetical protein